MFKFLRKYNKWILAIGGTLLMITFLIPFAFTDLQKVSATGGGPWAMIGEDEEVITQRDANEASAKHTLARQWMGYVDLQRRQQGQLTQETIELFSNVLELGGIQSLEHWILLVKEAESLGLVGGPSDANQLLGPDRDALISAWATLLDPNVSRPDLVRDALAELRGIGRMLSLYRDSAMYSDRRLWEEMKFMYHTATANVVVIPASEEPIGPEPTDEELIEQMNKYADQLPGEGERGFGYKLPDRVKLEWLAVTADSVREMLPNSEAMNNIALRRHWRENIALFGEPSPTSAIPDAVREDLLQELTTKKLDEIAKFGDNELRLHRRGLGESQGLLVLPEGWSDLSFEKLAESIQESFGVALPSFESRADTWLTAEEISELPGVGAASSTKLGDQPTPLRQLIFTSRIFNTESPLPVQVGIAPSPLQDSDQNIYFVRVLDADASRSPNSIDEVREDVLADVYRLRHYEQLAEQADEILADALANGLVRLALKHDTRVVKASNVSMVDQFQIQIAMFMGQPLRPVPSEITGIGPSEDAVGGIIRKAMSLPLGASLESLPAEERTITVPVDDALCLMVATITNSQPVTREVLPNWVQRLGRDKLLVNGELDGDTKLFNAFTVEALKDRLLFTYPGAAQQSDEEDAPEGAQARATN